MNDNEFILAHPPIVEAVLDLECDMPPKQELAALEPSAREMFCAQYPKVRKRLLQQHHIEARPDGPPKMSSTHGVQALQFLTEDEKQLVQVRTQGYSFNRLAPYSSLDDYLHEIERTWQMFLSLVVPLQIRTVRLRYINRLLLPTESGRVDLDRYLKVCPRLPDETNLSFLGFLNQHAAVENSTGHQVNMVLTAQPLERNTLPVIFDNCVAAVGEWETDDWGSIQSKIHALRHLKNRIFWNTLTERCLNLYQQP